MTTASANHAFTVGKRVLLSAGIACVGVGVVTALVGALVAGADAAAGTVVGTLIVLAVFGGGAYVVNAVASVLPAASMLIALLTYTLQVVLILVVFVAIERSGLLDDVLDRTWLGGAVIAGTAVWLVCQVIISMRVRIPVYQLNDPSER